LFILSLGIKHFSEQGITYIYVLYVINMKLKPMNIIFIGALIAIAGGLLTAWGTHKQNKASSKRMQDIQNTGESINSKSEQQLAEISTLKNQNTDLKLTIDSLNIKASEQQKTILDLSKQNSELSLQLAHSTQSLYGNLTGGDSFCELIIKPINATQADLTLVTHGNYPLYELSLRIVDLDLFSKVEIKTLDDMAKTQAILEIGNIQANSAKLLGQLNSDFSKDYASFNIFYNARNGFFTQGIRMFKIGNSWKGSTSITSSTLNKILFEKTDPTIPKNLLNKN